MNSFWDWWRIGNSTAALIAVCIACKWVVQQWAFFVNSERVRWMSFIALLVSGVYGPVEVVFAPDLNFRVPIMTIAVVWALISLTMKPRFPKEERRRGR